MIARLIATVKTSWILLAFNLMVLGVLFSVHYAQQQPEITLAKLRFACFVALPLAGAVLLMLLTRNRVLVPALAVLVPLPKALRGVMSDGSRAIRRMDGRQLTLLIALNALIVSGVILFASLIWGISLYELFQRLCAPVLAFTTVGPLHAATALTSESTWPGPPATYLTMLMLSTLVGIIFAFVPQTKAEEKDADWTPSAADIREIRRLVLSSTVSGAAGGLIGGALVGLIEAGWCYHFLLQHATELRIFWWAPLAYGIMLSPLGAFAGMGVAFLRLCRKDRSLPVSAWGVGIGLVLAFALTIIGRFRVARELMSQRALPMGVAVGLLGGGFVLFTATERLGNWCERRRPGRPMLLSVCIYVAVCTVGFALSVLLRSTELRQKLSDVTPNPVLPNVVFIVADSMRADVLNAYNPETLAHTPNLDQLAHAGIRFDMGFSQAPWTKPSFATMFSGLYPGDHEAESKAAVLRESIDTLPEQLAKAGYQTKGFANNRNLLPEYRLDQGFTDYKYMMPHLYFAGSLSVEQLALYQVLRRVVIAWKGFKVDIVHFYQPAEVVTDEVLDWLESKESDRPYFLFVHYMDSHDPYMTHDGSGIGYTSALIGENPDADTWKTKFEEAYAAEATYLDAHVGRLIERLDDAIIVFTSDHGEEFHEHGGWFHGPTVYEEVLKVPFIIRFPGGANGGKVSEHIARHIDLLPTILQFAHLTPADRVPGVPLFTQSGELANQSSEYSYAETDFLGNIGYGLRDLSHKLIEANPGNPSGMPTTGFYEMVPGEFEQQDSSGQGIPEEATMTEALHAIRSSLGEM